MFPHEEWPESYPSIYAKKRPMRPARKEVYDAIVKFWLEDHKVPPAHKLAKHLGKSIGIVRRHIRELQVDGWCDHWISPEGSYLAGHIPLAYVDDVPDEVFSEKDKAYFRRLYKKTFGKEAPEV